jgi:putative aldouronate transport system permease protein
MLEKLTVSRAVFNLCNYVYMILLCAVCLAPLWHVLMASVSDPRALMGAAGLLLKPAGKLTLKGYGLVFRNSQIMSGYFNTLLYVAATAILGTFLTLLGAFTLSRPSLKLKLPLTLLVVFTMMFSGGLIPSYIINRALGLINTRLAVIVPGVINAFYIIIMKNAFEQIPLSYEESAKLDGAGPLRIMLQILIPMIKATIAVIVMFIVVGQWNSWFQASIYLPRRRDYWPLQLVMREILVQNDTTKILTGSDAAQKADMTGNLVKYCVTIVGTLPILCVYPFAQKYFIKGVTLGGVKG